MMMVSKSFGLWPSNPSTSDNPNHAVIVSLKFPKMFCENCQGIDEKLKTTAIDKPHVYGIRTTHNISYMYTQHNLPLQHPSV